MTLGYIIYIAFIVIGCFWAGRKWLAPYLSTDQDIHKLTNKLTELEETKQNPHERIQEFNHWIQENAHSPFMKEFVLPLMERLLRESINNVIKKACRLHQMFTISF